MSCIESQQASFLAVHDFVASVLAQVNGWPMLGTPAWCSLAHDDPRKWAAVLDGARHHALRIEMAQEARAEASKAISTFEDWPEIGREVHQRSEFRAARPWMQRLP